MKKHYLFLMRTSGMGGAERLQMDIFSYINYNKYEVTWLVNKDNFSKYLREKKLPVKVIELPKIEGVFGVFNNFIKFYKYFRKLNPNAVVFNQFFLSSFYLPEIFAAFLITKGRTYSIVHDCAPPAEKYKSKTHFGIIPGLGLEWRMARMEQKMVGYFSRYVMTVSEAAKNSLIKWHKYPKERIKVVYHGIETDRFVSSSGKRTEIRRFLHIPMSDVVIISTARLDRIKRLDRLVGAFDILSKENDRVYLIFVGEGPEFHKLNDMVDKLEKNTKSRIKFMGFEENIVPLLQASDIYVLPSDSEGLSIACMEAMACGLIAISTDCGGQAEVIKDGFNGFLVEKSLNGVLGGLRKALELSEVEKEKIAKNARNFIINNFGLEQRAQYMLNMLGAD